MSEGFDELGVRAELITAMEQAGYARPSAIQRASVPMIRRGGSAVVRGPSGSGATTGVIVAVIDRLAGDEERAAAARALVVTSSAPRATRIADAAARCGGNVGVRAAAIGGGWPADAPALLVGTADGLLRAVRRSALKLDAFTTIVIDGAAQIVALAGIGVLEDLMQIVPRDAQRVILTTQLTPELSDFVEAHARRALNVPARSDADAHAAPHPDGDVGYVIAGSHELTDALARVLETHAGRRRAVIVRGRGDLERVSAALARRGFTIGDDAAAVRIEIARFRPDADVVIGYRAPLDTLAFSKIFLSGDTFVAAAGELAHLRALAAGENLELRPIADVRTEQTALAAFRARIRAALDEEDIDAQLLVLEPLFDERSPAEIAAALSALLRRAPAAMAAAASEAASSERRAAAGDTAAAAFVRLFISIGERDGIRPADILGAIAGEAKVPGADVGRIEIRDSYTVVEVPADAADRVIAALNGTTMRGRSLRVDVDRKGSRPEVPGARRGPGPRRGGPGGGGGRTPAERRR
jgi:ATP-dependent RNA helicase DeaD